MSTAQPVDDAYDPRPYRLSAAQKRHLVELYGDDPSRVLWWKTGHGTPQHRTAEVLERHGLVTLEGSLISRSGNGGFRLTTAGREVAKRLGPLPGEESHDE